MIYWESIVSTRSEDGPLMTGQSSDGSKDDPDLAQAPENIQMPQRFEQQALMSLTDFSAQFMHDHTNSSGSALSWFSLIEMYSTCLLTEDKDKLMAISGIAKVLQRQHNIHYLAGVWSDHLAIGLWWLNVGKGLQRPSCDRAPTWSWASWDGPVQFPLASSDLEYRSSCEFVSVEGGNDLWLNGAGAIKVRIKVLDATSSLHDNVIKIEGLRRRLFLENVPLWEQDNKGLWNTTSDPPLRLFNVSNAHVLWTFDDPEKERPHHPREDDSDYPTSPHESTVELDDLILDKLPRGLVQETNVSFCQSKSRRQALKSIFAGFLEKDTEIQSLQNPLPSQVSDGSEYEYSPYSYIRHQHEIIASGQFFMAMKKRAHQDVQKSWCVIDKLSEETLNLVIIHQQPLLFASVARFENFTSKSEGFHLVLLLTSSTLHGDAYRRVGVGVLRDSLLQSLQGSTPQSLLEFEERIITLV
jgi:hypothetical protein